MSKQKARKKYYFSVEGQTEELYFEWLEKEINKCPDTSCRVSFDCQVEPDPIKRIKKMNIIEKTEIWHIYEIDKYDNAYDVASYQEMRLYKNKIRIYSY